MPAELVPPEQPTDLGTLLHGAFRGLRHRWSEQLAPWGITPAQWRALITLMHDDEGMRLKVLADRLRIAPRSTTEVIDQLQALELVSREPDPSDRRAVIVTPTVAGRDLAAAVLAQRRRDSDEYFAPLDDAQRQQLAELLTALVEGHRQ
ncbi:MarR family winged helix-turn-helix transcriptional regulator [Propionibacteriaceae bacterium G57]|uniref:MarR family winged helix-turn-helix transcriptional regulator n=1 Tax=Aestuariimicrobium sp. G57 TaxID=3418485 RepID=UPI003DA6EDD2